MDPKVQSNSWIIDDNVLKFIEISRVFLLTTEINLNLWGQCYSILYVQTYVIQYLIWINLK